jgi:hypothetical protein
MKYRVTTLQEVPSSGHRMHLVLEHVGATSAQDAIRVGHRRWTREGWPGPFRYTESENEADPHDVWKSTW